MANYYYITIESDKMTQEVANEIFQTICLKQRVRHFNFCEGHLHYNTRGLVEIDEILDAYGFNDKEDKIEVQDEFNYAYEHMMSPEEAIEKQIVDMVKEFQRLEKHNVELSESMKNIQITLNNLIEENNHEKIYE